MNPTEHTASSPPEPKPADLEPVQDPSGGILIGLLLPAVQKVRESP